MSSVVCCWHKWRNLNFKLAETQWYDRKLKRILATSQKQNIKWSPSGSRLLGVFKAFVFRKVKQLKIKTSLNDAPTSSRQHDQILWDDVGRCGTWVGLSPDPSVQVSRVVTWLSNQWATWRVALKSVSKPAVGGSPTDPTARLATSQLHRPTIRTSKTTTVGSRSTTRHQKHPKTRFQILQRLFISLHQGHDVCFSVCGTSHNFCEEIATCFHIENVQDFPAQTGLAKGLNPAPLTFNLCVRELWVTEFDFVRTTLQDAWMRPSCQLTGRDELQKGHVSACLYLL